MTINNKQKKARELAQVRGQNEWLTPTDLQTDYGFSESTQAKYRMNRKIPFSKIGRYIRYKRSDIEAWLTSNKVEMV